MCALNFLESRLRSIAFNKLIRTTNFLEFSIVRFLIKIYRTFKNEIKKQSLCLN